MRSLAAAGTVLLHALILTSALVRCTPPPSSPPPPQAKAESFRPIEVRLLSTSESGTYKCESTYDGIGLMGGSGGDVWYVAEGGPAWRAGIREGDVLRGLDDLYPGKFPVGTWVSLQRKVGARWEPLRMQIEEICQK